MAGTKDGARRGVATRRERYGRMGQARYVNDDRTWLTPAELGDLASIEDLLGISADKSKVRRPRKSRGRREPSVSRASRPHR